MPTKSFDGNLEDGNLVTIGIDQSLTGFAVTALQVSDPSKYHTWVYKSPYFGVERLVDIRQFLFDHLDYVSETHAIDKIAMEGTVLASYSALVLGELSALVKLAIYDYFDDDTRFPVMVPPMTLKKYAATIQNLNWPCSSSTVFPMSVSRETVTQIFCLISPGTRCVRWRELVLHARSSCIFV